MYSTDKISQPKTGASSTRPAHTSTARVQITGRMVTPQTLHHQSSTSSTSTTAPPNLASRTRLFSSALSTLVLPTAKYNAALRLGHVAPAPGRRDRRAAACAPHKFDSLVRLLVDVDPTPLQNARSRTRAARPLDRRELSFRIDVPGGRDDFSRRAPPAELRPTALRAAAAGVSPTKSSFSRPTALRMRLSSASKILKDPQAFASASRNSCSVQVQVHLVQLVGGAPSRVAR